MACPPGGRVLPWASLLLLLGSQLLLAPVWSAQEKEGEQVPKSMSNVFLPTVEFAVHWFNENSPDLLAYRLWRILSSWQVQVDSPLVFTMKLQLGRTMCRKFKDNLESCPFQDGRGQNDTFTCFFTIGFFQWETKFSLLNYRCLEHVF